MKKCIPYKFVHLIFGQDILKFKHMFVGGQCPDIIIMTTKDYKRYNTISSLLESPTLRVHRTYNNYDIIGININKTILNIPLEFEREYWDY